MSKPFIKGFKLGFKRFGDGIANIVNFFLLFFAYFLGVGIVAIFSKIFSKHYLDLFPSKKNKTYWNKHAPISTEMDDYYRQF